MMVSGESTAASQSQQQSELNLWQILTKGREINNDGLLFKAKEPKKYIQVKT